MGGASFLTILRSVCIKEIVDAHIGSPRIMRWYPLGALCRNGQPSPGRAIAPHRRAPDRAEPDRIVGVVPFAGRAELKEPCPPDDGRSRYRTEIPAVERRSMGLQHKNLVRTEYTASLPAGQRAAIVIDGECARPHPAVDENAPAASAHTCPRYRGDALDQRYAWWHIPSRLG